jgi:hypothetical protein
MLRSATAKAAVNKIAKAVLFQLQLSSPWSAKVALL